MKDKFLKRKECIHASRGKRKYGQKLMIKGGETRAITLIFLRCKNILDSRYIRTK